MRNNLVISLYFLVGASIIVSLGLNFGLLSPIKRTAQTPHPEVLTEGTNNTPTPSPYSTSCYPPTEGCGSNNYWDSNECKCREYKTCQPASSGCGSGSYWDSSSCSCRFDGTSSSCTPPQSGCGANDYWDYNSCSCKDYENGYTSSCSPPSSGCGNDKYWDSYYCACKSYTSSSSYCNPPSSGCGYNYYWDSYSCSCKPSTSSCPPPSEGCGYNYYWDYYNCSCKPYEGQSYCYPPASGCVYNYYWDTSSCLCKPNPNVTPCSAPTAGCSSNTYWDYYSCSCKDTYPYYEQHNFDRLAYESQDRVACVKSKLTQYEFDRLRYFIPTTSAEQDEINLLGIKSQSCWAGKTPPQIEGCLKRSLGESAYKEIYYGTRQPTYEEHLKFEVCNEGEKAVKSVVYYTNAEEFSKEVEACLRSSLTPAVYQKVESGISDVPFESREKVNRCFGINPQAFEEARAFKIPDEVKACLLEGVGESRFTQISLRGVEPTDEEKEKGLICFDKLHDDQLKFLPLPPEQVPFLETDTNTIRFSKVAQETQTVKNKVIGGKVTFSGFAPPGSAVNIYIYSEPIVVTTKTNENGDWVYELEQPLEGEKHVAYATVRDSSGKIVKSTVFDFTVVAAEEDIQTRFLEEGGQAKDISTRFLRLAIPVVLTAIIGTLFLYFYRFKKMKKNLLNTLEEKKVPPEDRTEA